MKNRSPYLVFLALVCATAGVAAPRASAQTLAHSVVMYVDDTDPSHVTFTATTAASLNTDFAHPFMDGIDLLTFFTFVTTFSGATDGSSLTAFFNGVADYNSGLNDNLSGTNVDLNLYYGGSTSGLNQAFLQETQAFSGTLTLDLDLVASALPAIGTEGDIYCGESQSTGLPPTSAVTSAITNQVLIGQYLVVPEANPAVLTLVAGAVLLTAKRLRRRVA